MSILTITLRIILSAVLGGLVGFEREIHGRTAGFRTLMLVSVGSALFMIVSLYMAVEYSSLGSVDPSRIAAGVVTGIGFLGASTVMRFQSSVQGLTTAATIWAVSAIGLAVGAGLYWIGIITTAVVVGILLMSRLKKQIDSWGGKEGEEKTGGKNAGDDER